MKASFGLLLLFLSLFTGQAAAKVTAQPFVSNGLSLTWTVNGNTITFTLAGVAPQHWAAVGWGATTMGGKIDLCMVFGAADIQKVSDRMAHGQNTPVEDTISQDCIWKSTTTDSAGNFIVTFDRAMNLNSAEDKPIATGSIPMILSTGWFALQGSQFILVQHDITPSCKSVTLYEAGAATDCVGNFGPVVNCSKSCGRGKGVQVYTISVNASTKPKGKKCPYRNGYIRRNQLCNAQSCDLPCVAAWNLTKACSKSCGVGTGKFVYTIVRNATGRGKPCKNVGKTKTAKCNTQPCLAGCSQHQLCSECATDLRCGFCFQTTADGSGTACMEGNMAGPTNGPCFEWDYELSDCGRGEIETGN